MSGRSVHEAAVVVGAAGLCVRDGEGCPAHYLCEAEARRVIAALAASAEVREVVGGAIAGYWRTQGARGAEASDFYGEADAILAALAGTEGAG